LEEASRAPQVRLGPGFSDRGPILWVGLEAQTLSRSQECSGWFKPILKKARGVVATGHELTFVVSESGLGPGTGSNSGTVSNLGTSPYAVSDLGAGPGPGTDSLLIHFSIIYVASSAIVQEEILANQTLITPRGHVDLGRGPAMSKPLNYYFRKSKAMRGPTVIVSAAIEEWLSDTLGLTGMAPPTA
jgi:hypothetical protein